MGTPAVLACSTFGGPAEPIRMKRPGFENHGLCQPVMMIHNNVVKTITKLPIWEWFIPPIKMVVWGMVDYCFNHITLKWYCHENYNWIRRIQNINHHTDAVFHILSKSALSLHLFMQNLRSIY